jgi:hypothetical protein
MTAVGPDGVTESLPSAISSTSNDLSLAGNFNIITATPVNGAPRYNFYKRRGGGFGYIGQAKAVEGVSPQAISSIVRSAKVVTVTTGAAHGFTTGDKVLISGTTLKTLDGLWSITVTGTTTFTYTCNASGSATRTTGTASVPQLSIVDDNVLPDNSQSPPDDTILLNEAENDYPTAVTYHEQRRWFAGTNGKPQVVFATRNGTESNLTNSIPARDADGLEVRVASMQNNQIIHLVPLTDLIAFTRGGEFRIYADNAPSITPTSITIKPQGYGGANNVQPVVTTGSILYVQAQGSRVREMAYGGESSNYGYKSIDVSVMVPHRLNGFEVVQLAYSRAPEPTLWAVRNDGTLLGMTYLPEQQVFGWHAHDTEGGVFESCTAVAENNEDALYVVVRRTINGRSVRYVERLNTRVLVDPADAFFVDSGLSYSGSPISTLSGLHHLEGQTVDILADGAVEPRQVVSNGQVTLSQAASKVSVGLPITADVATLPLALEGAAASGQGTAKNVNKVHLRVNQASIVKAGPSFDRLREYPARAVTDPYGSPPALRNGELSLSIDPSWNQDGHVCVRQDLPLPLTLLSLTLEVQAGG